MFKMTLSKIKKMCYVALIPRILRDEVVHSPRKLGKRPIDGFWKMAKSTDSKNRKAECEKCKKLIEKVFGPDKPVGLVKQVDTNKENARTDKFQKVVTSEINTTNESNSLQPIENTKNEIEFSEELSANILKSTTAKTTEEQLAQKLETIEEPGLVEAATPKIDGFNTLPKVLGDRENILDSKDYLCSKIKTEQDAFDEISKKCLNTPPNKIDEHILEEMKSCGMLGRGRKKYTSNKSGYHTMKNNRKEAIGKAKPEENTIYSKNQQNTDTLFNNYNVDVIHKPHNIYPACFKNVDSIGDSGVDKDIKKNKLTDHTKEKDSPVEGKITSLLASSDNSEAIDSDRKSPIIDNKSCNNTAEEPKKIENLEAEVEEIRVNATDVSRLEIPGETEIDPDFDHNYTKSDKHEHVVFASRPPFWKPGSQTPERPHEKPNTAISGTFPQISQKQESGETKFDTSISSNQNPAEYFDLSHCNIVFSSSHPSNWKPGSPIPDRRHDKPNTAISGTLPRISQKQAPEETKFDTSISSNQNPAEYYDLSHCNIEKVADDYISSMSEIRALPAFHQYNIMTGADEEIESENDVFTSKYTPEICFFHSSEIKQDPYIEKQDLSNTKYKDITTTIGPLPQLQDIEEKIPLKEMVRRIREKNRLEYCRQSVFKAAEAEPVEASRCPSPLDKSEVSAQEKPLGPGPCRPKPKPKPACPPKCPPPCPPPPPPPCPPPKCPPCPPPAPVCPPEPCKPKDPCAKFTTDTIVEKIKAFFFQVAFKPNFASSLACSSKPSTAESLRQVLKDEDARIEEKLEYFLLSSSLDNEKQFRTKDVILAKDFEPWSPIPSWPITKKEKKQPFVCPKEGCKLIPPPRLNSPCKEKPCEGFPKRTFSSTDLEYDFLY